MVMPTNSCLTELKGPLNGRETMSGTGPSQLPGTHEVMDLRGKTITVTCTLLLKVYLLYFPSILFSDHRPEMTQDLVEIPSKKIKQESKITPNYKFFVFLFFQVASNSHVVYNKWRVY